MIMTSYWLLSQDRDWNEEELKTQLSGNICRCTGYRGIIEALKRAKELMREEA